MKATERLLRWYPPVWRERYGDEFEALIEDTLADRSPTVRLRLSIALSGLRERANASGLIGATAPQPERSRTGGLVVLWSWTAFVVAGCAVAKRAEHSGSSHPLDVLVALAVGAQIAVVIGGLVALPSTIRFVRDDGRIALAVHIRRAVTATVVVGLATAGLVAWAHSLSPADRETGSFPYGVAFAAWAITFVVAVGSWTALAFATARRVDLSSRVLALEVSLALGVAAAMAAMTVATVVWWLSLGSTAPGQVALIVAVMLMADAAAGYGVSRLRRWT